MHDGSREADTRTTMGAVHVFRRHIHLNDSFVETAQLVGS